MTRIVRPGVDTGILGRTANGRGPVRALSFKELATALQQPQNLSKPIIPVTHSIPAGGTTGQVLEKDSNTDYDASWHTPGSSSGGVTSLGFTEMFNPTGGTSLATGFFFGRTIVATEALLAAKVQVAFQTSSGSAKLQPCIYAVSIASQTFGTLRASGPVVTGAVRGVQDLPLTTPLAVAKGDVIMYGFICDTAAPDVCATRNDTPVQFMSASTGSPPNPASGVTDTTRGWGSFWLSA